MSKIILYFVLPMIANLLFIMHALIRKYWLKRKPEEPVAKSSKQKADKLEEKKENAEAVEDQDNELIGDPCPNDNSTPDLEPRLPAPRSLQPSAIRVMCEWPVEQARTRVFYQNPDFARSSYLDNTNIGLRTSQHKKAMTNEESVELPPSTEELSLQNHPSQA